MAKFLVLIYDDESGWAAGGPAAIEGYAGHARFAQEHGDAIVGGEALALSGTAKSVRGGVVSDGPFLRSAEALGGYYVVEAEDIDAAIEIAKHVPVPFGGGVEVRPVEQAG